MKKPLTILALTLVCVLALTVGCGGSEQSGSSTTVAPSASSLDPALLGKWQAINSISEQNANYLGSELDFRITTDDMGNPTGQLLTPTGNGVTGYGDLYARDGVMRFGGEVGSGVALEAAYTIEGDTLTIIPAAETGLAAAVYRRAAE